jgi:hypothetical protein
LNDGGLDHGDCIDRSDRPRGMQGQRLPHILIEQSQDAEADFIFGLMFDKFESCEVRQLSRESMWRFALELSH